MHDTFVQTHFMKKALVTSIVIPVFLIATLNSNSGGPASAGNGNKTGGPGSAGSTCASCHSGGIQGTTMRIALRKKSNNTDVGTSYNPGATYIVKITGNHPSLTTFGFQMMSLKPGNTQAGSYANLGNNHHTKTQGGVVLVEQHHPLSKTGSEFSTEFEWVAPETGTGNVTFYGVLNAVNGDGGTGGDAPGTPVTLTLNESPTGIEQTLSSKLNVYPNPANDYLYIGMPMDGECLFTVFDMTGKKVADYKWTIAAHASARLNISALNSGTYFLSIASDEKVQTIYFVKQ